MTILMTLSICFQLAAAFMALKLIRISGIKAAWSLVAFALLVMAARRGMILLALVVKSPASEMAFEGLGLIISIFMFIGILLIKPLFAKINNQQQELEGMNLKLEERVNTALEENLAKDRMLMMKGREAAMGEMIKNIAHQWKQPLNSLGLSIQEVKYGCMDKSISYEDIDKLSDYSMTLINHMSQTINDFSNFFNPAKSAKSFSLEKKILLAKSFVSASCMKRGITITVETIEDSTIDGPENEFVQVLMNLFQNAADALTERDSSDRSITVCISRENGKAVIKIKDNAGGIKPEMLGCLFDAYITSKSTGTGIGLYMSKMIIRQSFNGDITASNTDEGAEFRIEI